MYCLRQTNNRESSVNSKMSDVWLMWLISMSSHDEETTSLNTLDSDFGCTANMVTDLDMVAVKY